MTCSKTDFQGCSQNGKPLTIQYQFKRKTKENIKTLLQRTGSFFRSTVVEADFRAPAHC